MDRRPVLPADGRRAVPEPGRLEPDDEARTAARWSALTLGLWFLAASWGNKLAGVLGAGFDAADPAGLAIFFLHQAALVAVAALLLAALVPWLKRLMGDVR